MSKVIAVIGAQWGDEGKGKIVDLLAEQFEIVARYHQMEIKASAAIARDLKQYTRRLRKPVHTEDPSR